MFDTLKRRLFYKNRKFYDDDFDWNNYTADSYKRRIQSDIEGAFSTQADFDDIHLDPETGEIVSPGKPLHPNHALIFETIGALKPTSVHEVGCGGGDHVANARILFPDIEVTGGDRGETQLQMALERHPELAGKLGVQDITMPFSSHWPEADLVYSQAVIMHIHTAVSHFVALANVTRMARNFVLLIENMQCHNFVSDIRNLFASGHLAWDDLYLYRVENSGGARGILMSRKPQDMAPLNADPEIRDGLPRSERRLKRADEDSTRALLGFERV